MKTHNVYVALACALTVAAAPASAALASLSLGTSAPPVSVGTFDVVPFALDPAALGGAVSGVALPAGATPVGNVGFDTSLVHYRVDAGNPPWATWSNGYNKDVYWLDVFANMAGGADSVTLSLPANTQAFYFYVEPGTFGAFDFNITATGGGGAPLVLSNVSIDGQGGAKGFAFYTGALDPAISSISISGLNTWPDGFAIGEFGINGSAGPSVPEAGSTAAMLGAAFALAALLAKRRLA